MNVRAAVGMVTAVVLVLTGTARAARAATVLVINGDSAGEGFGDPTPFSAVGGNGATTLGQARMLAFQHAADLWGGRLVSPVEIRVAADFSPLSCNATSAVLGAAGTNTAHRDFEGAPHPGTWYPQALAKALAGVDLDPSSDDLSAHFSTSLDGGTCLGGARWYYGLDGHPPAGQLDFVTVVLHELGHGLGFLTFVNLASGEKLGGHDDAYMLNLQRYGATPSAYPDMTDAQRVAASTCDPDLRWTGFVGNALAANLLTAGVADGHVRMYGPPTQRPGSSVSHVSVDLFPNELMEPGYTSAHHDLSLTAQMLRDTGWTLTEAAAVPALSPSSAIALAALLLASSALSYRRGRRQRSRPTARPRLSCRPDTRWRSGSCRTRPVAWRDRMVRSDCSAAFRS